MFKHLLCVALLACVLGMASCALDSETPSLSVVFSKSNGSVQAVLTCEAVDDVGTNKWAFAKDAAGDTAYRYARSDGTKHGTNNKLIVKTINSFTSAEHGSWTCRIQEDDASPKTSPASVAVVLPGIAKSKKTTLTVCRTKDKVKLTCDVGVAVGEGSTLELLEGSTAFAKGENKILGNSITKTVAKADYKPGTYTCQLTHASVTTISSEEQLFGVFASLKVCDPSPKTDDQDDDGEKKNSAPRMVNSFAIAVVCLLATVIKFSY